MNPRPAGGVVQRLTKWSYAMKLRCLAFALLASGLTTGASADPWKDESGKYRERDRYSRHYEDRYFRYDDDRQYRRVRREVKEEFYDGRCKVKRKWGKNGEYKEERKCR